MLKKGNIVGILKILILVISVCFLLTACSGTDVKGTNNSNQQTAMSGADRSSSQLAKDQRDCWQSSILELMYRQMGSISLGLYKQMTDGALAFIMVAFAVWFSFRLMRHVSSLQEENIAEVWKEVFKQLFICFVCGLLASSTAGLAFVLNTIIFPLYYTFLEFAGEMLNAASAATGQEDLSLTFLGEKIEYGQKIACVPENLVTDENLTSFPAAPINMMSCIACAINERLGIGFYLAFETLHDTGFMALVIGCIIFLMFTFIKLAFIFYLVDTLFRFTIVVTILPALILAYAFKQTRSWATFGFMTMINSAAYMMFVAIMIAVALLAMHEIMISPALGLSGDNIEDFRQNFKEFSIPVLCLLLLAFLIQSTMKIAQDLTNTLVGGDSSGSFKDKGAKAGAMVLKFFTLGIGGFVLNKAKNGAGKAWGAAKGGSKELLKWSKGKAKSAMQAVAKKFKGGGK